MFENLTDKLERSFRILKGEGRITEINVAETLKEIRRALIDADVNYKVAKTFTDQVKAKALGQDVLRSVKPGQMMTKIVRDELAQLMGGTAADIRLEGTPAVVLIAGLQGSGKTTFSGKLASWIRSKKGRQVLLVAGDVYRPAAIDQLQVLGKQIGVEVYTEPGNDNPVTIAENAIRYGRPDGAVHIAVSEAGGNVQIRVRDHGPGIPEAYRESVFQPFFRVDKSRSRAHGGVGLGLSLVWEIAALHGGTVQIERSGADGTVMLVTLPRDGKES